MNEILRAAVDLAGRLTGIVFDALSARLVEEEVALRRFQEALALGRTFADDFERRLAENRARADAAAVEARKRLEEMP